MKQLFTSLTLIVSIAANAQNLHGDLETWRNVYVQYAPGVTLESPFGWYSADSLIFMAKYYFPSANFSKQVSKTTDAHSSNYAAKLVTLHQDTFGTMPALLTNAIPVASMLAADPATLVGGTVFYGGTSVSQRIDSINAWIKYLPKGVDTAKIAVKAVLAGQAVGGNDSVVGGGILLVSQTYTSYAQVSVSINYITSTVVPDKLFIFFESSNKAPKDSSTLYVDDASVINTTSVTNLQFAANNIILYPNPTKGLLYVNTGTDKKIYCKVYNGKGQLVNTSEPRDKALLDLSYLPDGTYFYYLTDDQGNANQFGKFSLIK